MKIYTGIGARTTPKEVLTVMYYTAIKLASLGYILRSGGSVGADSAFELGCDMSKGKKEIFIPWENFNGRKFSNGIHIINSKIAGNAYEIASNYHPYWHSLNEPTRKIMARNVMQVLGIATITPSNFIICYTPHGKDIGGTSQAIRIAKAFHIPIYNLGNDNILQAFENDVCP